MWRKHDGDRSPTESSGAKELQREVRSARDAVATLASQLAATERDIHRLIALKTADADAAARLDSMERVLDRDAVRAHVRTAIARAPVIEQPLRHAVISDLLPSDACAAIVAAIPPPIFFDDDGDRQDLRLPLRLAPTWSLVAWMFVTDVVTPTVASTLIERFGAPSEALKAERGEIVRRRGKALVASVDARPQDVLWVVVHLGSSNDEKGSSEPRPTRLFNSAIAVLGPGRADEHVLGAAVAPAGEWQYTYEFAVARRPVASAGKV
jgi:hypothetical protein